MGGDDRACPPQWVRSSRGSGTKRVEPVEGSSDESEGCKGVKAQEEPDDKFQIIISSLKGPKPSIFGNPLKLATLIWKEFGDVHSAKKLRSGDLLIQCKSVAQREKF